MSTGKILIVDDSPTNSAILEELLSEDYQTLCVESGEKVISLALEFKPDLVLLDVMMQGIDGYETCRWIRSQHELKATRVILVSAMAMPAEIERGLAVGADDYVTKPFDIRLLGKNIRELLSPVSSAL